MYTRELGTQPLPPTFDPNSETVADPSQVPRDRRSYVSVYSGPEPPSGGVSLPPFAVIAPHCTQFDGAS